MHVKQSCHIASFSFLVLALLTPYKLLGNSLSLAVGYASASCTFFGGPVAVSPINNAASSTNTKLRRPVTSQQHGRMGSLGMQDNQWDPL